MNAFPLLTVVTFLPLAGGLAAMAFKRRPDQARQLCLVTLLAEMALLAALLVPGVQPTSPLALREDFSWIAPLGVRYALGMDGLSYALTLLTLFLGALGVIASRREVSEGSAAFNALLMASLTSAIGVFLARDLFLFYLFWESQLIPMFFLIARWGHEERRRAAVKFFLFSIAGGLPMLLAVIALMLTRPDISLTALTAAPLGPMMQGWLLASFLLAFAVKTPLVPVHTWLPDAHTQAPTAGSLLLAGVLLKTGAYAILRWGLPLFPQAAHAAEPVLAVLGVIGLFYASWIALAQADLKRLVAYSSIAHMGLIMLGLAARNILSLSGAVVQMVSHALTTGALFVMVGMLIERTGSRQFSAFGGLWKRIPVFSGFFLFFALAAAGLPGLSNFVGEIMILAGAFAGMPVLASIAFAGVVAGLIYVLRMLQGTLFGPVNPALDLRERPLPDLSLRELVVLTPLAVAVLFIGLHPAPLIELIREPLTSLAAQLAR